MKQRSSTLAVTGAAAICALVLAGCGSTNGGGATGEDIELTLSTWGQFGYEELIEQYQDENPGITIVSQKAADPNTARDAMLTALAAGTGLADVVAVESGFVGEMMQYPDKWVPVDDSLADRWLPWKSATVTDGDGVMRMYGVDAAPAGLCYDKDLFAEAGFPTDRVEVSELLTGSWDHFYEVGAEFVAKTGKPWISSVAAISQAKTFQMEYSFEDSSNAVIATTNPDVRAAYDEALSQMSISALIPEFSDDWNKGLGQHAFAVQVCPSWMLGYIKSLAPDATSWDIADAFPGGGMNWGGSFLAVPTQSKHAEEASKFAAWLTAPDQQLVAFQAVGAFPSQVEALSSDVLLSATDPYVGGAPIGEIFASRAEAAPSRTYRGPLSTQLIALFNSAVIRVETGAANPEDSWATFESDVASLQ